MTITILQGDCRDVLRGLPDESVHCCVTSPPSMWCQHDVFTPSRKVNLMHPFAIPGRKSGANGMKNGDRVRYVVDGRTGVADEFLHDGDAFVSFDDGSFGNVKWNNLVPDSTSAVAQRE